MMDHEEDFLNLFFTQVSQLNFEKAKELAERLEQSLQGGMAQTGKGGWNELEVEKERERESSKPGNSGPWGMLLTHLPQIAVAEHSYVDLGFLLPKNKGFLRKDGTSKYLIRADFILERRTHFTR
uniref:Uncharacterized protein n=1 Tax=Timema genevievae TaxID=629358 RepID=A0A7R9JPF5_TIMGE|nr:unnamed protein product [Timema genevievae]